MPINSFEDYPMSWKPQKADLKSPYYLSIAAALESDIKSGRLPEHAKLPPQRELADFLDLNLSTITRAYKLCELKGLLYAVTGKGTFVSPCVSAQDTFLEKGGSIIEMGMIKPFYETNPIVRKAALKVLDRKESLKLLEYSEPLGTARQLDAACRWLHSLGIPAARENVLLTAGAQNALSVTLISLFKAGDKIVVDRFTYTNFKSLAHFLHIQLIAVEGDEQGMSPEALLQTCKNTEIKGIYLMPSCSNPTGICMPLSRRRELAEIIERFHLLLIEDDIYSFLIAYGGCREQQSSFFSLLPEQTVHICSISKSLCAGLRVAFLAFPGRYREDLTAGLLGINLKTVSLNSEIIAELILSRKAEEIVSQKIELARRRNEISQSIFPMTGSNPVPTFFHWLPIPDFLTSERLETAALQAGIHILGSHRFAMQQENSSSYVRVSITSPDTEAELKKGLMILKELFEKRRAEYFV